MIKPLALAPLLCLATAAAHAHITLPPGGEPAGSVYTATFRVGHACKGASATNGITVRTPAGFTLQDAQERPGWTMTVRDGEVSWQAISAGTALPTAEKTVFVLRGKLPATPGTLWFKVLQSCDQGSADWAEIPDANRPGKPAFPAARLDVLPAVSTTGPAANP